MSKVTRIPSASEGLQGVVDVNILHRLVNGIEGMLAIASFVIQGPPCDRSNRQAKIPTRGVRAELPDNGFFGSAPHGDLKHGYPLSLTGGESSREIDLFDYLRAGRPGFSWTRSQHRRDSRAGNLVSGARAHASRLAIQATLLPALTEPVIPAILA